MLRQRQLKKWERDFDNKFDIGICVGLDDKLHQYAVKNRSGKCANVKNKDIKSFIKEFVVAQKEKAKAQERKKYQKELIKKIEQIKQAVAARHGTQKYDSCYDDVIEIIK